MSLGRIEDVLAALAVCANLPLRSVLCAYDAEQPSAVAAVLRGTGYALRALLVHRRAGTVPADILATAYADFEAPSPLGARRLVRSALVPQREAAFLGLPDLAWPELAQAECR